MDVLKKIELLRKQRGWSKNNLAMEAFLTQSTINNLYSRETEPKLSTLRAICGAFGITLSEFFKDDTETLAQSKSIDEEIIKKIALLSEEQKKALLVILNSIKAKPRSSQSHTAERKKED